MPLRSSRGKAAVVPPAVRPGPAPIAKAAVVGGVVSNPNRGPVAKVGVGAVASPGRRRF